MKKGLENLEEIERERYKRGGEKEIVGKTGS